MYEKVNPCHPDKVADRIAGAIVDLAYNKVNNPKIAVEVLLGHGVCTIIVESSVSIEHEEAQRIVQRITNDKPFVRLIAVTQDHILAGNQEGEVRCGDNGIFKGHPVTYEQAKLTDQAATIYSLYPSDGKYILNDNRLIICQSCAKTSDLRKLYPDAVINPLGDWTGGTDVDAGATNRKLGSDMGDGVTGGGLHGKDLSKADVSLNIYCYLKAQELNCPVAACCAIGDTNIIPLRQTKHGLWMPLNPIRYDEVVAIAQDYIQQLGGFEKFAEWGLIRALK